MSRRRAVAFGICLLAGLGAFVATLTVMGRRGQAEGQGEAQPADQPGGKEEGTGRGRGPVGRWLDLTPEQTKAIEKADPAFADESAALTDTLSHQREALARLLEDPKTSDDQVRAQVEAVIVAHNKLERRVANHLLAIRKHLSPIQQKRLMSRCAAGVRRAGRGRGGRGSEQTGEHGRGGRGPGRGRGEGLWRRGRGGQGRNAGEGPRHAEPSSGRGAGGRGGEGRRGADRP